MKCILCEWCCNCVIGSTLCLRIHQKIYWISSVLYPTQCLNPFPIPTSIPAPINNIPVTVQAQIQKHKHTHISEQAFIMSDNGREYCRHDTGRRFTDPTRIQDPDGDLMAGGSTDVGPAPTYGDTGRSRTMDVWGQGTGADSGYYLRSGQPRQQQPLLRGQGRLQGRRGGQQGQSEVVRAGDDVDGHGVGISSGSGA